MLQKQHDCSYSFASSTLLWTEYAESGKKLYILAMNYMFMYLQLSPIMCACIFGNIHSICLYHKEAQTHFINVSQIRPDIANILTRIILFIKIFYAFQCGTSQCMNHSNVSFHFLGKQI